MAIVLEGVDLVALCAILVLMGLLIATRNTFVALASVLDKSILGVRPFHSIAVAIENTIIAGCNVGIRALGSVAHDLWAGLLWTVNETVQAIMSIPNGVHAALNFLWDHAIPTYVKASIAVLNKSINAVDARVDAVWKELSGDVVALETMIKNTATATAQTLRRDISSAVSNLRGDVAADIRDVRVDVKHEIAIAVGGAEAIGNEALDRLRRAEDAAIEGLRRSEDATAQELRDLIKDIPLTDIAAALAAIPLLRAAVDILEAETGLGRAECRAKVKNICGTDPSQWAQLLEGLVLVGIGLSIQDVIEAIVGVAEVIAPEIQEWISS